jgi:membrane dipeptidase
VTTKGEHGPSRDWLNVVRTSHAREKIRQWFKRKDRDENIVHGRESLERELRRLARTSIQAVGLERIAEVYGRGIRQLQIVHYMPSDLGDQQTEPGQWKGLSPLGAEVIRECNRLGMVVDVAHGTYQLVEQAAQVSAVPFILSHTSLSRGPLRPYTRLISVEHARLMAQAGGVIGIWPNGNLFVNAEVWVADIARTVDAAGVDHVGIGTDMEGGVNEVWADYGELPTLVNLLLARGFSPEDTSKLIGGNYVRILTKAYESRKTG